MARSDQSRPGAGGPKTAAGKARAAQNAFKHGLSGAHAAFLAAHAPDIARLAASLVGPAASPARRRLAHDFAAAHIDLRRARRGRREILERPHVDPPPSTAALVKAFRQSGQAPGPHARRVADALRGPRAIPLWAAAAARLRELCALERYERRAFSRRQSALRALDALALEEAAAAPPPGPAADANLAERTRVSAPPGAAARIAFKPADAPAPPPGTVSNAGARRRARVKDAPEPDAAWEQVAALAFVGMPPARIAGLLKISVERLRERFADALDPGPGLVEAQLAIALVKRATAGDTRAAIFFLKARAGWRTTGPPRTALRAPPQPTMDAEKRRALIARIMAMADANQAARPE